MSIVNTLSKNAWNQVNKINDKIASKQFFPGTVYLNTDINYMNDNNPAHTLDIYYPHKRKPYNPVILQIHGGGWMAGTNRHSKRFGYALAEKGFIVVNINYRLIPETGIIGQIEDCLMALKWIWENIHYYSGNRRKISIAGESAGGFLASYTALIASSEKLSDLFELPFVNIKVSTLGLISPVCYMNKATVTQPYYDELLYDYIASGGNKNLLNIDNIIDEGKMPPTFIVTSTGDIIAKKYCDYLHTLLRAKRVKNAYACWQLYKGKFLPHAYPILFPTIEPSRTIIDMMATYFKKVCKE